MASDKWPTENTEIRHLVQRRRRLKTTQTLMLRSTKSLLSESSNTKSSTPTTRRTRFTRSHLLGNEPTWLSEPRNESDPSRPGSTSWRLSTTKNWPPRENSFQRLTPCQVRLRNWGATTLDFGFSILTLIWSLTPCSLDIINVVKCIQLKFNSKMSLILHKLRLFPRNLKCDNFCISALYENIKRIFFDSSKLL